ncbi:MAG: argininosuccinate lyase [Candidatus Tectomicrobia bacterium]|nr:argininosuccinate lyase [Candidatus Tectomicrobia bacterium]
MARRIRKPWGGRFKERTAASVEAFTESVSFDRRLAPYDVRGSIAHARMLAKCGILSKEEGREIVRGLRAIAREIAEGRFRFDPALEDVHMNVEARLIQAVGPVGGKLHTARSRNDQVALDLRLYLRDVLAGVQAGIGRLKTALLDRAEAYLDVVMPGYTHMRRAQPVLFAHHLLAYVEMLNRDEERMSDCRRRVNVLPLGSGALSGTGFPIDRAYVAGLLGFERVSQNSLDAVSDRDFAVEFASAASLLMMHLSRLAEEMILWSGTEFGFLTLPEAYCTGSSMMPQKRNPDVLELVRGKTGRAYGALVSLLTMLKAQPLSYNRDLQEDKEPVFDAADTVLGCLAVLAELTVGLTISEDQRARMRAAAEADFTLATELADSLAMRGVPFREAHEVAGRVVRFCEERGLTLSALDLATLRRFSPFFGEDALGRLSVDRALRARNLPGGTSPTNVKRVIRREKRRCAES